MAVGAMGDLQDKPTLPTANMPRLSRALKRSVCENGKYYSATSTPKCLPCPPGFWCMHDTQTVRDVLTGWVVALH
jgi:hypothetical protein